MNYQTFQPSPDLAAVVKCYWTLEVPAVKNPQMQRIIPDGCIEMAFILGDDIKRYTAENEFILQPRAMVLGQIMEPFYIEPTGQVNSFAVRFYPIGFANFVTTPVANFANKETPISLLFGEIPAKELERSIIQAADTNERVKVVEDFLITKLQNERTIDSILTSTVNAILSTKGSVPIKTILKGDLSKRRQLERKFKKQVGMSPKQLGKVIRLQTALKMLLNRESETLTQIAYNSEYYDQAHFIKDFKEFTGINPKVFLENEQMTLSSIFYKEE